MGTGNRMLQGLNGRDQFGITENDNVELRASLERNSKKGETSQFGQFIVSPSGTGKQFAAMSVLTTQIEAGRAVMILDCGKSYIKAVQNLGGLCITLHLNNTYTPRHYGDTPLVAYEFEDLRAAPCVPWTQTLPLVPCTEKNAGNLFILLDETAAVSSRYPGLVDAIKHWVKLGASFCITGQCDDDVAAFRDLLPSDKIR